MPIQGDTLNHRLTTPNKLFEAMAAGVPAVVSDLPGMRAVVADAGSGILVDPTDIGGDRGRHPPDPRPVRGRVAGLARAMPGSRPRTYNWETQVERLLDEYTELTGKRW